jgi:hypothetical protein
MFPSQPELNWLVQFHCLSRQKTRFLDQKATDRVTWFLAKLGQTIARPIAAKPNNGFGGEF